MPPDGHRSEGTLSLSEVPYAGAKPFGLPFRRLEKVTRCKSETIGGRYRSNGYTPKTQNPSRPTGRCDQTNKNGLYIRGRSGYNFKTLSQDKPYLRSSSLVISRDS